LDKNGLTYKLLAEYEDIDTHKELLAFYEDLKDKPKNDPDFPKHTWSVISRFFANN
jgi:hypothetical protein